MRNTFLATLALAVVVTVALALGQTPGRTLAQSSEAPQLVFQTPANGSVVNEHPAFMQICFADPVNIRDLQDGGDFAFTLTGPDGLGLGLQIIFQVDGYGATIVPGPPPGETIGGWILTWLVTSPDGEQASEGEINYTVDADGDPTLQEKPPACIGEQGTATPPGDGTPSATTSGPQPSVDATATPDPGEGPDGDSDDGDSNLLLIALIAIGAVMGVLVIGFVVSRAMRNSGGPPGGEPSGDL